MTDPGQGHDEPTAATPPPGTAPPDMAPVPERILAAARAAPGQWIGLVDPNWQGEGQPPDWAVIGRWRAGEDGSVEEFAPNAEYRPSPLAREWPAPTDPVDAAVQLAATGYGPGDDVYRALASARVAVLLDEFGTVGGFGLPDGEPAVVVFSARSWLEAAGSPGHAVVGPGTLLERLPPGLGIVVNPGAPAAMRLEPGPLWAALDARERAGDRGGPLRPFG
ncbi:type VII secretion system-associated protein [Kitasatospora sp. NPDC057738]|uniref:type VII secretion system-associated protein n=1 Tax=Kitasatospora sp. NPDC057738 TaxID=3346233 RepID=UPI003385773C